MAVLIRLKRGNKASLPTLAIGEPAVTLDTYELYVGTVSGNKLVGENTFLKLTGGTLTGYLTLHADPTQDLHAVTKRYVDNLVQGLKWKEPVRVATTENITLSGLQTIDGVSLSPGDRVLVKDQTNSAQNGIYVVGTGAWVRASDADSWNELVSASVFVMEGTVNADKGFVCTVNPGGTLGTTPITFIQFSAISAPTYTFSDGLLESNGVVTANIDTLMGLQFSTTSPKKIQLKVDTDTFSFNATGALVLSVVDGGTW